MSPEQEAHRDRIVKAFTRDYNRKWSKGCAEHKDDPDLEEVDAKTLIDYAIEEALDQVSYLYTLREKLEYSEE